MSLAAGESLSLVDGNTSPGGALYVGTLLLAGGVSQIADIGGNGLDIYYDPATVGNAYLRDQVYALTGGGFLEPTLHFSSVPEPGAAMLLAVGAATLLRRRRSPAA